MGRISSVFFSCVWAAVLLAGCATQTPAVPEATFVAPTSPAAQRIMDDIVWLSDDERGGRDTGSAGYKAASDYVAARYDALGLTPAGDNGGWFQRVPLRSSRRDLENSSMRVAVNGLVSDLVPGEDFMPGIPPDGISGAIEGEAVFVGYGVQAPEFGIDDYAGVDLQGKIAVLLLGAPPKSDMPSEEAAHYSSGATTRATVARLGGKGIIGLYTESFAARYPWERYQANRDRAQMDWVTADGGSYNAAAGFEASATLNPEQSDWLLAGQAVDMAAIEAMVEAGERPAAFDLPARISLSTRAVSEDIESRNVIALLEGSDPVLKEEYVVLTAHLDHVGEDTSKLAGDRINNGAMDNSVGVSTMLEAARKFVMAGERPRRSILFVALTAEEKGLLGSEYFAVNPTVPKGAMVANVNLDMPIITYDFTDVIAFGAQHSTLEPIVRRATESMGVALSPDPVPHMALFVRSDHYRFVQQGIPSVFLFLGFANGGEAAFQKFMSTNYHRPGDEYQDGLNFNAGAKFAEINFRIAREIANAGTRPRWNEDSFFGNLYGN